MDVARMRSPQRPETGPLVLAINSGSSSLKVGVYCHRDGDVFALLNGSASGVGRTDGRLKLEDAEGKELLNRPFTAPAQREALGEMVRALAVFAPGAITMVGHRVVHGGPHLTEHQRITPEVMETLRESVHFAPLHIPPALALIKATEELLPGVPQFACFDTAFHTTIPPVAHHYAVPERFYEQGLRRYGFHGLSYESILHRLRAENGGEVPKRVVCAHLGSGASLTAVLEGRSVDTSMGLTPLGGVLMSSRPGDLDPGVVLYLLRAGQFKTDALEDVLNHQSGLRALSGGEADMQALVEARAQGDRRAALAVEAFAMSVRKFIGAYEAVLGGVDLLIFSGGIGEHSAEVRGLCCEGLKMLGVFRKDAEDGSGKVRVMQAEEEMQIARHCFRLASSAAEAPRE